MNASEFEQVSIVLSAKVVRIATEMLWKHGYAGIIPCDEAPDSYEKLVAAYAEERAMIARGEVVNFRVWGGASETSIYVDAETNYLARAWHDLMHVETGRTFSDTDEVKVGISQSQDARLTPLDQMIVLVDSAGQTLYKAKRGEFPVDQRAFVIECLTGYGF